MGGGGVEQGSQANDITQMLEDEETIRFEEEIGRNPYVLDSWLAYLDFKRNAKSKERFFIFERALKCLPRSYKLWRQYLQERQRKMRGKSIADKRYTILVNAYERSLVHLHKMPRIWLDYCELLMMLKKGSRTRRTFDRALQALPVTQHDRIWTLYLQWVRDFGVQETAVKVFRRYMMYDPMHREDFVNYLLEAKNYEEAATQLAQCVNDDDFVSPAGHSKHQLWMKLCDLCAKHPEEVDSSLNVDAIIRSGIARFTDEVGRLWCKLADYYIRLGQFERARDIFEEGIASVVTVRDFTTIFDTYAQFEESVLTAKMNAAEEDDDDDDDDEDEEEDDIDVEGNDMDLRLARLEHLMERRPLLLSSVLLRQNPHNVTEWQKRVKLYLDAGDLRQVIICYTEAVKTVVPSSATGKPQQLWISFAKFYEEHGDVDSARQILEKATQIAYKNVDDLADVWCAWGELELRQADAREKDDDEEGATEAYQTALEVMQRSVAEPDAGIIRQRALEAQGKGMRSEIPVQERLHKSVKVWTFYLDLEESLGTVETTRAAYNRVLELRIATPQIILNFAAFLEENKYFEEGFTVFEKGVSVFKWPHVKALWHQYLDKFTERYAGTKLERARDLFEQALRDCPPELSAEYFIKYAKLEEEHGLVRHAMAIYDRATQHVEEKQKFDMYMLYITKAESFFGVTRTRQIYEAAIKALPDKDAQRMALEYAQLERKLGEIDRARAIFTHGAQFMNPKREPVYWKKWHEFEVAHGNQETFRDMIRVKKSVETVFANETFYDLGSGDLPIQSDAEATQSQLGNEPAQRQKRKADEGGSAETNMEALERQAARIMAATKEAEAAAPPPSAPVENPEEIDLDDDEEEEAPAAKAMSQEQLGIQQKSVPSGVFGSLAEARDAGVGVDEGIGALERMKKRSENS